MLLPPYCTNVHPGGTLQSMRAALDEHAVAVRNSLVASGDLGDDEFLPLGAWLAAPVVQRLREGGPAAVSSLRGWLDDRRMAIATLNGFPFADFHAPRVKHSVYQPDWTTPERRDYTIALVECLPGLAPSSLAISGRAPNSAFKDRASPDRARSAETISISTLPLGWPTGEFAAADEAPAMEIAARQLLDVVEHARRVRDRTGRTVRIDLEPEPGCVLQRADDVVAFAERYLRPEAQRRGLSDSALAEHLGVCLDVCHLAVMFEDPLDFVRRVHDAGLPVGKVQLSSAPRVDFGRAGRQEAVETLRSFAEDRYLHQTMVRLTDGAMRFSDDLPEALAWVSPTRPAEGEWRVHFHVPIHLERIAGIGPGQGPSQGPSQGPGQGPSQGDLGTLETTRDLIVPALRASAADSPVVEVETYAWTVLPPSLRPTRLAEGIAEEVREGRRLMEAAMAPPSEPPVP